MRCLHEGITRKWSSMIMCPGARYLLLCTAITLSYCFVVTVFLFHVWREFETPCSTVYCNQSEKIFILKKAARQLGSGSFWARNNGGSLTGGDSGAKWNGSTTRISDVTSRWKEIILNMTETGTLAPSTTNYHLDLCPVDPPNLLGPLDVSKIFALRSLRESDIMHSHPELSLGGAWSPPYCTARHKMALILPYRDRKTHLNQLLSFLIPILQRQLLDFRIIVAEQYGSDLFNKGRIMNAAFTVAERLGVDCVIFHDVDMFPQDDRIPYTCPDQPRHVGAYVDVLRYSLWYNYLLGGVVAIRMEHYRQVNGHSNLFWGWGGEDDDLGKRVLANNLTILRPPKYAKYTMLRHSKRRYAVRDNVNKLLNDTETRWHNDGLNETKWSIVALVPKPLYLHLYVDVGVVPNEWIANPRKPQSVKINNYR